MRACMHGFNIISHYTAKCFHNSFPYNTWNGFIPGWDIYLLKNKHIREHIGFYDPDAPFPSNQ